MNSIEKIKGLLSDGEAALITTGFNRRYLTGFESSDGAVVITKRRAVFIIDFRYYEMAKAAVTGLEVVLQDKLTEQVAALADESGAKKLLIETGVTVAELHATEKKYARFEVTASDALSELIDRMRSIKSQAELDKMDRAQQITDYAFSEIIKEIKPGMAELEVAAKLEYIMKRQGAVELAFQTICVSGENSSKPHGVPGYRKLKSGDFLTMDFGARYDGYCSDMTRTVVIGRATDEMKKVYYTVLEAQKAALAAVKEGIRGCELDKVARDIINKAGYEGCFGHGLGHSVGLEIHESPRASVLCEDRLLSGMLMTVEPGVYLAGKFGVRIEDMVVITKTGCIDFTKSEKELIEL